MAARYPVWVSQHGPAPTGFSAAEWAETLGDLTREQLQAGFAADKERGAEWPPSSPQFLAMCKPPQRVQEWKSLPKIGNYTPEVAEAERAKIAKLLGMKS